MADIFSPQKRSEIMRAIRSKNTKAEIITFRYLRNKGVYFQKHYAKVPGRPDIALPRKKVAVFIDGDFWHGKTLDRLITTRDNPENDYWVQKIKTNMKRDVKQNNQLEEMGWRYIRIWDRDVLRKSTREQTLEYIAAFLNKRNTKV
jgi:DNA mismatch endonuclease (patch repair protein)